MLSIYLVPKISLFPIVASNKPSPALNAVSPIALRVECTVARLLSNAFNLGVFFLGSSLNSARGLICGAYRLVGVIGLSFTATTFIFFSKSFSSFLYDTLTPPI